MKTQIIQLEPHDDVISIRDKMAWGQTGRILLVWPGRGEPLLDRKLDLVLLQRHAGELGTQLALITLNAEVRFFAAELDIPVYRSAREAQTTRWGRRGRPGRPASRLLAPAPSPGPRPDLAVLREKAHAPAPRWLSLPAVRTGFFSLGVVAVLAIGAVLLPNAHLTLVPQVKTQELTFTAFTGPGVSAVNLSGAVPTRSISVVVEGRNQAPTTGSTQLPGDPATGRALFTNLTNQAIVLPAGTVVRTLGDSPVRFATTRQEQLPAGAGSTVEAPVRAVGAGSAGNVGAGEILSVEGNLGAQVSVENPSPLSGGTDLMLPAPNAHDRRLAYRQLLDSLRLSALEQILAQLLPGDILLTATPFLAQTLEESYSPAVDEPTDSLVAALRLEFQAQVIRQADLAALAQAVLDADIPAQFAPVEGTLAFDLLAKPTPAVDGSARWPMQARRTLEAHVVENQAVGLALGLAPALARDRLAAALPLAGPPTIALWPAWWPRLPFLPFRITVDALPQP